MIVYTMYFSLAMYILYKLKDVGIRNCQSSKNFGTRYIGLFATQGWMGIGIGIEIDRGRLDWVQFAKVIKQDVGICTLLSSILI